MKKKILILFNIICIFLLTSCEGFSEVSDFFEDYFYRMYGNGTEIENERLEIILDAIENEDIELLKSVFSKNALESGEDFDEKANELFELIEGEIISYDDEDAASVDDTTYDVNNQRILDSSYDIKTSEGEYRIAFIDYIFDEANLDNEGIYCLHVIRMEDSDPTYTYHCGYAEEAGINIEVKEE